MDRAPDMKRDEQYPLLKVDGGGGDGGIQPTSPTIVNATWGVTHSHRQSWIMRWPEYFSACWMTFILLSISFLVFYTIGMETRKHPVVVIKCNTSKPASDVYYHHIVQRGTAVPFVLYAEYLSSMAMQYPFLNFHVWFLLDDSLQTPFRGPRHTRFFNRLIPTGNFYSYNKLDDFSKRDIAEFQRRYQNINVTITPLSKFMAVTPLKYKWRTIPIAHLPFYARIFSVWQNGGIGIDLSTFNNYYNSHQKVDRRILAILRQHNNGIKAEDYTNALNKIDREEDSEFINLFLGMIHDLFNETRSFLCKSFTYPQISTEIAVSQNETLVRNHRNKRQVSLLNADKILDKPENISNVYIEIMNSTNDTDLKSNEYLSVSDVKGNPENLTLHSDAKLSKFNSSNITEGVMKLEKINQSIALNKSDEPHMVFLYDFTVFSHGLPYISPQPRSENVLPYLLSIDSEGNFIAAASKLHPFLGHLVSAGCQRLHPRSAIQNTIFTQCSGIFRDDTYCNNIYLL